MPFRIVVRLSQKVEAGRVFGRMGKYLWYRLKPTSPGKHKNPIDGFRTEMDRCLPVLQNAFTGFDRDKLRDEKTKKPAQFKRASHGPNYTTATFSAHGPFGPLPSV